MPHLVKDNAFPLPLIAAANAEWPNEDWQHWHVYGDDHARKLATKDESRITPACRLLLHEMARFVDPLLPEDSFPDLSLHGAGMHELPDGGFLARHLDSDSYSQRPSWRRAASGVLYLNDGFSGGGFCLEESGEAVRIEPKRNRLVLFRSSDDAWHWVEEVRGGSRRTLALFWWRIDNALSLRTRAQFA